MKKIIATVVLTILAVFGLSARGLLEEEFTGNISYGVNDAGESVVLLVTTDGSYVLNIPDEQLAGLDLAEGQEISVEGELLRDGDNGENEVNVRILTVDGKRYKVELEDLEDDGNDDEGSPSYGEDDDDDEGSPSYVEDDDDDDNDDAHDDDSDDDTGESDDSPDDDEEEQETEDDS